MQGEGLEERVGAIGGVQDSLVEAFRLLLTDADLDPSFVAAAISLPGGADMVNSVPEANPVTLHHVRCHVAPALTSFVSLAASIAVGLRVTKVCRQYVVAQLAARLRPELEAVVKRCEAPKGQVYAPVHEQSGPRALKNKVHFLYPILLKNMLPKYIQ